MIRRDFLKSAAGSAAAFSAVGSTVEALPKSRAKYRAGVIGLGWTGVLYDLAKRGGEHRQGTYHDPAYDLEGPRPNPDEIDIHRKLYHHDHPGNEGLPISYSEALVGRDEVELVAGAERDQKRLEIFGKRYGLTALYTDAIEMMRKERLDIVAVCTNVKGRAMLTAAAVEHGAKAVITEKPMVFTLEEADLMVNSCAKAGAPLVCGAITTTHPSFEKAKELVDGGALGEIQSLEAGFYLSQHQNWTYFIDSPPAWVSGIGDEARRENGSTEFVGQGMMVTQKGQVVHYRPGGSMMRISGGKGEIAFDRNRGWRLWQDTKAASGRTTRVPMPWPDPQFVGPYGAVYSLDDALRCLAGTLDEPKNSGRRVAMAIEVEIALKLSSARGGQRVELPLKDRSLGLTYAWFR